MQEFETTAPFPGQEDLNVWSYASRLSTSLPTTSLSSSWKKHLQCTAYYRRLDRVNVLGSNNSGHTGCVNALSWAKDGELLLSGGDDTTVRIWRLDTSDTSTEYPYVCDAIIRTGHRGNIFNNVMLPHSNKIASVARDKQIRVFDIGDVVAGTGAGRETVYTAAQANVRVLKCHTGAVKKIATEGSSDVFLTVSEDGTVRQHDLRVNHTCERGSCTLPPLVQFNYSLSALSMSPLTPWQFVVAGELPYGFLFDRRQIGRHLQQEWGVPPDSQSVTTCVRRFGREQRAGGESREHPHITGCRMASDNGHEVLLSYSSDAVYLYSTRDEPREASLFDSGILKSNEQTKTSQPPPRPEADSSSGDGETPGSRRMSMDQFDALMEQDIERMLAQDSAEEEGEPIMLTNPRPEDEDEDEDEDMSSEDGLEQAGPEGYTNVPVVLPRARFAGLCNVETVKDVNFLGPRDEFIVSGSDDGNFFIWDKASGKLCDILQGDGHVVNVVEGHPHLPLIAVSGIDTTVKLFAPARRPSAFSQLHNADNIMSTNEERASRRIDLADLMMYARIARRIGGSALAEGEECTTQ